MAAAQAEAVALRHGAEAGGRTVTRQLETTPWRCSRRPSSSVARRCGMLATAQSGPLDLVERRRALFVQLEQLRSGRDSLVEVVDAVEATVEELKGRLAGAEHDARMAAAEAGDRAELFVDDEVDTLLEPDIALELQAELLGGGAAAGEEYEPEAVGTPPRSTLRRSSSSTPSPHGGRGGAGRGRRDGRIAPQRRRALRQDPCRPRSETAGGEADASGGEAGEAGEAGRAAVETGTSEAPGAESEAPAVEAAVVEAPVTEAPVTEAPVTEAPTVRRGAGTEETPTGEAVTEAQESESVGGPAGAGAGTESPGPEEQPAAAAAAGEPETATVLAEADDAASAAPAASHDEEPAVDGDDAARLRRDELSAPGLRLPRTGAQAGTAGRPKRALERHPTRLRRARPRGAAARGGPAGALRPGAAGSVLADSWLVGRTWLQPTEARSRMTRRKWGRGDRNRAGRSGRELADRARRPPPPPPSRVIAALRRRRRGRPGRRRGRLSGVEGPTRRGIAGDFATRAFAGGAVAASEGTLVRWVVDDGSPARTVTTTCWRASSPPASRGPRGRRTRPSTPAAAASSSRRPLDARGATLGTLCRGMAATA